MEKVDTEKSRKTVDMSNLAPQWERSLRHRTSRHGDTRLAVLATGETYSLDWLSLNPPVSLLQSGITSMHHHSHHFNKGLGVELRSWEKDSN